MALLRLRKSMDDAKQDHERPVKTAAVVGSSGESKGYEVYPDGGFCFRAKPSGEELPSGARKARRILTPKVGSSARKSDPSQVFRKAGKGRPKKAGPTRMEGNRRFRPSLGPQQSQSRTNQWEDPLGQKSSGRG